VLVVAYAMVVTEKMAERVALRNAIDSLINDICTHEVQPVIGCRVT
jgi:hypothetical protein